MKEKETVEYVLPFCLQAEQSVITESDVELLLEYAKSKVFEDARNAFNHHEKIVRDYRKSQEYEKED